MDCSVLVPVLNEERYIELSVAAMQRQVFAGRLEFLFADGGSHDRTRQILGRLARSDPRIRIFDNPKGSVSSGLNVALRHARGRWAVRMDAHTIYPPDYIATGVARLQETGKRWLTGPQVPKGHGPVSRAVALALASRLGQGGSRKWGSAGALDDREYELDSGVFGGVWERSTLLDYGGWDERWPRNEDSEMAGRFIARGERPICVPAMGAEYVPRDSLRGLWRQYREYAEYRVKTAVRHPHTMRRAHLVAPAILIDGVLAVAGPRRTRVAACLGLRGYAGALVLEGIRSLPRAERRSDALLVPVVLAVMHSSYGVGVLLGVWRNGVPAAALASVAGLQRLAESLAPAPEPVCAPSLQAV